MTILKRIEIRLRSSLNLQGWRFSGNHELIVRAFALTVAVDATDSEAFD